MDSAGGAGRSGQRRKSAWRCDLLGAVQGLMAARCSGDQDNGHSMVTTCRRCKGFRRKTWCVLPVWEVDGCAEDTNAEVRATGMAKVEESREGDEMKE